MLTDCMNNWMDGWRIFILCSNFQWLYYLQIDFIFLLTFGSYGSIPWKHPSLFFLFYHPKIAQVQFRSPLFCTALTNIHPSVRSTLTIPCLVSLLCIRHVCIIEGMLCGSFLLDCEALCWLFIQKISSRYIGS